MGEGPSQAVLAIVNGSCGGRHCLYATCVLQGSWGVCRLSPVDRSGRAHGAITDIALTAFSSAASEVRGTQATATAMMTHALHAYSGAVGADTAGFYEHVRDGWSKAYFLLPDEAWRRLPFTRLPTRDASALHPGVRHALTAGPTAPFTITDLVTQRAWLESDLGRAMKADWGRNFQLMSSLADRPGGAVCLVWVLGRPSTDFSRGDREVAAAVQPLLSAITRHYVAAGRCDLPAGTAALVTEREGVVLALLLAGHRPLAIAAQLEIPVRTVDKHLERIYRKFDVHDRHTLAHVLNREMQARRSSTASLSASQHRPASGLGQGGRPNADRR